LRLVLSWIEKIIRRDSTLTSQPDIEDRKARATTWFEALRDEICLSFERLEDEAPTSLYSGPAGRFVRTHWQRADHTGAPGGGPNSDRRSRARPKIRDSGRPAFR
jgi:hypothetical protein